MRRLVSGRDSFYLTVWLPALRRQLEQGHFPPGSPLGPHLRFKRLGRTEQRLQESRHEHVNQGSKTKTHGGPVPLALLVLGAGCFKRAGVKLS